MAVKKHDGLQIEDQAIKPNFFYWTLQKIILILMLVILLAALLGLTGSGILGKNVIGEKNNFQIEYDQFARKEANTTLNLILDATKYPNTSIVIAKNYLKNFYIKDIIPQPIFVSADAQNIIYQFRINPSNPVNIAFLLEPQTAGIQNGTFGILNGPMLHINQFIFP